MRVKNSLITALAVLLVSGASLALAAGGANKTAVVGASTTVLEFVGGSVCGGPFCEDSTVYTILDEMVKTPTNGDLAFYVTMECFVGSYDLDSGIPYGFGIDYRRAFVQVWVEVDGTPLYGNNGKVIFCGDEVFQLYGYDGPFPEYSLGLRLFGGTHGFNWAALNVSKGWHDVAVKARLGAKVLDLDLFPDEGTVAVIGKRSLIIEPIHVDINETIK